MSSAFSLPIPKRQISRSLSVFGHSNYKRVLFHSSQLSFFFPPKKTPKQEENTPEDIHTAAPTRKTLGGFGPFAAPP